MEKKFFRFDFVQKNDDGEFKGEMFGRAAIFDVVDKQSDIILPTAFDKSLVKGGKVEMFYRHQRHEPVGVWTDIWVEGNSLNVRGMVADTARGRDIKELMKIGALDGLSIGGKILDYQNNRDGTRVLKEILLEEVSLCHDPANAEAGIVTAKTIRDFEAELRDVFGFSQSQAKIVASQGYNAAFGDQREVDAKKTTGNEHTELLRSIRDALVAQK